ncbi:MAG: hypothetical protein RL141_582 [Candidatus Parcubacteria bacterium]|jgi:predicted transcriptional regulator
MTLSSIFTVNNVVEKYDTFMKESKIIQSLTELGLRETEARLYIAALTLGPTTILKLARATNIKRTTVYPLIDELKQKGLISMEIRGFKKLLAANPPDQLASMVERHREQLQRILPDLSALHNAHGQGGGSLKYYEGLESIKSVYEGLLRDVRPREDYLILGDINRWLALDSRYFMSFVRRRAKLPINIRMLLQDSTVAREHQRLQKTFNEQIRILPPKTALTTNLVVIPTRVVIHQLVPPYFAIVIENKSVIQMHREQFEIMWNATPKK